MLLMCDDKNLMNMKKTRCPAAMDFVNSAEALEELIRFGG